MNALLLQRVLQNHGRRKIGRVVRGRGIGTATLRKREIFDPASVEQTGKALIAFDAARLGVESVLSVTLSGEFLLDGPGPGPNGRIFDRDLVGEGHRPRARPALHEMQVLARALVVGFRTEVGYVDHQRVALPMATRVAVPLADVRRQVGAAVHDDVALPPLSLAHVVEHRDPARRLHDPAETAGVAAKLRQSASQAALPQRTVLRTIVAIHSPGDVARSNSRPPRPPPPLPFPSRPPRQSV